MPISPEQFDYVPEHGVVKNVLWTLENGNQTDTKKRLVDGAYWLAPDITGDVNQKKGWFHFDPNDGTITEAPMAWADRPTAEPATYQGVKTFKDVNTQGVYLHPSFAPNIAKPGYYRVGANEKLQDFDAAGAARPAEKELFGQWKNMLKHGAGKVKDWAGGLVDDVKGNIQEIALNAAEQTENARWEAESRSPNGQQSLLDASKARGMAALGATSDLAGRVAAGTGKGLATIPTLVGGGVEILAGKAVGSKTTERQGKNIVGDGLFSGWDRAKAQETQQNLAEPVDDAVRHYKALRLQGRTPEDPELRAAYHKAKELQAQMEQISAVVERESSGVSEAKNYLKGIGELTASLTEIAVDFATMEATGGIRLGAKGLQMAAKTATTEGLEEGAKLAAKKAIKGASVLERVAASDTLLGRALTPAVDALAPAAEGTAKAGLGKRVAGRLVQGAAMNAPFAGMDFSQRLAAGEDFGDALAGATKGYLKGLPTTAVMLSSRLGDEGIKVGKRTLSTKPFAHDNFFGAMGNAAIRTGFLAGVSTANDVVFGGVPAFERLPEHIKGLLGMELVFNLKGVRGARIRSTDLKAQAIADSVRATTVEKLEGFGLEAIENFIQNPDLSAAERTNLTAVRDGMLAKNPALATRKAAETPKLPEATPAPVAQTKAPEPKPAPVAEATTLPGQDPMSMRWADLRKAAKAELNIDIGEKMGTGPARTNIARLLKLHRENNAEYDRKNPGTEAPKAEGAGRSRVLDYDLELFSMGSGENSPEKIQRQAWGERKAGDPPIVNDGIPGSDFLSNEDMGLPGKARAEMDARHKKGISDLDLDYPNFEQERFSQPWEGGSGESRQAPATGPELESARKAVAVATEQRESAHRGRIERAQMAEEIAKWKAGKGPHPMAESTKSGPRTPEDEAVLSGIKTKLATKDGKAFLADLSGQVPGWKTRLQATIASKPNTPEAIEASRKLVEVERLGKAIADGKVETPEEARAVAKAHQAWSTRRELDAAGLDPNVQKTLDEHGTYVEKGLAKINRQERVNHLADRVMELDPTTQQDHPLWEVRALAEKIGKGNASREMVKKAIEANDGHLLSKHSSLPVKVESPTAIKQAREKFLASDQESGVVAETTRASAAMNLLRSARVIQRVRGGDLSSALQEAYRSVQQAQRGKVRPFQLEAFPTLHEAESAVAGLVRSLYEPGSATGKEWADAHLEGFSKKPKVNPELADLPDQGRVNVKVPLKPASPAPEETGNRKAPPAPAAKSPESIHEEILAAREKQPKTNPAYSPEVSERFEKEITKRGSRALAITPTEVLERVKEHGAQLSPKETAAPEGRTVLTAKEYEAILNLENRSERRGEGKGSTGELRDTEQSNFENIKAEESLRGDQARLAAERIINNSHAAEGIAKLYKAGILTDADFLQAAPTKTTKPNENTGDPMKQGNSEFRKDVTAALDRVSLIDQDVAAKLHEDIIETRTGGEGLEATGRWIPNPKSVEALDMFRQDAARAELPAEGDPARQRYLNALANNGDLHASMQRVMAGLQTMNWADRIAADTSIPEAKRAEIVKALRGSADDVLHAGDMALFAHLRKDKSGYFKPIMEAHGKNPQGDPMLVGKARGLMPSEEIQALTNPNYRKHVENIGDLTHQTALEKMAEAGYVHEPLSRIDRTGFTDADIAKVGQPKEVSDHLKPGWTPEDSQPAKPNVLANMTPQQRDGYFYGNDRPKEKPGVIDHLDRVKVILKELNPIEMNRAIVANWRLSGDAHLEALANKHQENIRNTSRALGENAEAKEIILPFMHRMDPALVARMNLDFMGQHEEAMGSYQFGKNVIRMHTKWREAVRNKQTSDVVGSFVHEMSHFATRYMDGGFRDRVMDAYEEHLSTMTVKDPFMRAVLGAGSPLYKSFGEGSNDIMLTEAEYRSIKERLSTPEIAKYLEQGLHITPDGFLERAIKEMKSPLGDKTKVFNFGEGIRGSKAAMRLYRFLNPDEYLAENFADFVLRGSGVKTADREHGFGALEMDSDMRMLFELHRGISLGTPKGGGIVREMLSFMHNARIKPEATFQHGRPEPITEGLTGALKAVGVTAEGPNGNTVHEIADQVRTLDRRMMALAEKNFKPGRGMARLAVELTATDAISPISREGANILQPRDGQSAAWRAHNEVMANPVRQMVDKAFAWDRRDAHLATAEALINEGKATEIRGSGQNHMQARAFEVEIAGKKFLVNTDRSGKKVSGLMSEREFDAVTFLESNGKRGGAKLPEDMRQALMEFIPQKIEMENYAWEDLRTTPGVDSELLDKGRVKDYLMHSYLQAGSERSLDRIHQDTESVVNVPIDRLQKRTYQDYAEAWQRGGLLPRLRNPIETYLQGSRQLRNVADFRRAIGSFEELGWAHFGYRSDRPDFVRINFGPEGSLASDRLGFEQPRAESDNETPMPLKDIYVHKDIAPELNAMFGQGLAQSEAFGKTFRNVMKVNNLLLPAKLGLSGFHAGKITTLGWVEATRSVMANYDRMVKQGVPRAQALTRAKEGALGQILVYKAHQEGKRFRELMTEHGYKSPEEIASLSLSDLDKATMTLLQTGNYGTYEKPSLQTRERDKLNDAAENWADAPIFGSMKLAGRGYTALMENLQGRIMEDFVSPTKMGHTTAEMKRYLKRTYGEGDGWYDRFVKDTFSGEGPAVPGSPYITTPNMEYARNIVSHADYVFGMANYRKLMMSPVLRDIMFAWNTSFGWRHGNVGLMLKGIDQGLNKVPVVGGAYKGAKRGLGSTGIHEDVSGRNSLGFIGAHGLVNVAATLALGALGLAAFPAWKEKKDADGNEIKDDFDVAAFRTRLEDLLFPVLSDRLNHNGRNNRWDVIGYGHEFGGLFKHPAKWATTHASGNSPLMSIFAPGMGSFWTGKDAINQEIGNPYNLPLPKDWQDKIAEYESRDTVGAWAVQRAMQVPQEFLPISVSSFTKARREGESLPVALTSMVGNRKISDYGGYGDSDAVQAGMAFGDDKHETSKDAFDQEKRKGKSEAVAEALNASQDAEKTGLDRGQILEKMRAQLLAAGVQPVTVTNTIRQNFDANGKPLSMVVRLYQKANGEGTFDKRLSMVETATNSEFRELWPLFEAYFPKPLETMQSSNPRRAIALQERIDAIKKKRGIQ